MIESLEAIAVTGIIVTNIVTIITLYLHLDNKTDKTLCAIQTEMKDFHGRLEKQDAEFKAGLLLLEEKYRRVSGQ